MSHRFAPQGYHKDIIVNIAKLGLNFHEVNMTTQDRLIKTLCQRILDLEEERDILKKWNRQALDNNEVNTHDIEEIITNIKVIEERLRRVGL